MWTMKYHKFLYIWMQAKKTNKQTIHILACILFDDLLTTYIPL